MARWVLNFIQHVYVVKQNGVLAGGRAKRAVRYFRSSKTSRLHHLAASDENEAAQKCID
jgi:hypothetical protein